MHHIRISFACACFVFAVSAWADETTWNFVDWDGPDIPVRMYVPGHVASNTQIVIVMHGASRDAERYFRDWQALGEEHGLIVVVPEFSKKDFKGSAKYNLGYVFARYTNKLREEGLWTFSAIEPLFDEVVDRVGGGQSDYVIYGHSGGSQFVHRFMYYKPNARVSQFIAANAGWYTLPVDDFKYPYGFVNSNIGESELPAIFKKKLIILLGREDTDENDENLRKTSEARQQGPHRLARGLTLFRVAKARAAELGLEFNWKLYVVSGAGHVNAKMAAPAAALLAKQPE